MGSSLEIREEKVLATVKDPVGSGRQRDPIGGRRSAPRKAGLCSGDLEDARQAPEEGGGPTSFQDELMREHKHAGFGKEVCVDVTGIDNRENLAVD